MTTHSSTGFGLSSGENLNDDLGPSSVVATMVIATLAGLALVARLVSRAIQRISFGASDVLAILGLLFSWVVSGLVVYGVRLGAGRHLIEVAISDPSLFKLSDNLLNIYLGQIFYTLSLVCVKISILLLYREIFVGKNFFLATNAIGAFVIAWGISTLSVSIFSCRPVRGFWDIETQLSRKCISTRNFFLGNSVPNILADIAILILPVYNVWKLQISRRSKFAVSCLFLLGGFVVVASCIRVSALFEMDLTDATWTYLGISVWSSVELNVAVISACLPTIRPLLKLISHSCLFSRLHGRQKNELASSSRDPRYLERSHYFSEREMFERLSSNTVLAPTNALRYPQSARK